MLGKNLAAMRREFEKALRAYLVEFVVYAALLVGYYFLVLHFLGGWLNGLFHTHRGKYAALALGLIAGQGVLLDIVTRLLLSLIKPRTEDE